MKIHHIIKCSRNSSTILDSAISFVKQGEKKKPEVQGFSDAFSVQGNCVHDGKYREQCHNHLKCLYSSTIKGIKENILDAHRMVWFAGCLEPELSYHKLLSNNHLLQVVPLRYRLVAGHYLLFFG